MSEKIMNHNNNMNVQDLQKLNKEELIQLLIGNVLKSSKAKSIKETVERLQKSGNSSSKRVANKNNGFTGSIQQ